MIIPTNTPDGGESMLVKVEAYFDGEHWCAKAIGHDIYTQGDTLDELMNNVKEAVALHFEENRL